MGRRTRGGFTLLEVLLVVAILVILAGSATVLLMRQFDKGKLDIAATQVAKNGSLAQALDLFKKDMSRYPTTEEGLKALLVKPEVGEEGGTWAGPYLKGTETDLKDPWGTTYQYVCADGKSGEKNKEGYDLSSAGPDKKHGTDDDIGNWTAEEAAK